MTKKQTNEYRKNVKDSVFKDLFGRKEYSLQLYKTLFPCDEEITEDDINNNVLRVYMEEHREEAESIMDLLFDEETINRIHDRALIKEAREEGIRQGMKQGMIDVLVRQFNDKKISAKEGADYLGITVKGFLDLVN